MAAARSRFEQVANAEGLEYSARTHWYNSIPAHEAALWADAQGDGEAFRRAVYRAYFAEGLNIGSAEVLANLASGVGLNGEDVRVALADGRYREKVQEQFEFARQAGVTGVPTYIAGRYSMVGAQPYEIFQKLIETAQRENGHSAL
jgi:predicted DsbA family dithiol-disulfide isomerase